MNKRIISLIIASTITLVQSNTYCWTATGENTESSTGSYFWSKNNQSNNKNNKNCTKNFAFKKADMHRLTLPLIAFGVITLGYLKKASQKVINECKSVAKKYSDMSDTNKSRLKIFVGSAISLGVLYLFCRYYLYENDYFSKFYTWLFGDNWKGRPGDNGAGQPNNFNYYKELQKQAEQNVNANPQKINPIILPTDQTLNLNPANLYPAPMNQPNLNKIPNNATEKHYNRNAGTYNHALDAYNSITRTGNNTQFNQTANTNDQNNMQAQVNANIEQKNGSNGAENKLENKQEANEIDPTKIEYVIEAKFN